jgi:hypothetical protein
MSEGSQAPTPHAYRSDPPLPDHRYWMVATLVCHAHMAMALDCLGSLRRLSADPISLQLHDDGSLTGDDIARLLDKLGPLRILRRAEADERTGELLKVYPAARAFRAKSVLALKLLDAPLLCSAPVLTYCDSDILFLKRFKGFNQLLRDGISGIFMLDRENSYSLRSWQKLMSSKTMLPSRVNTGLFAFQRQAYDLDYIEWFVSRKEHTGIVPMLEQTAWAALGMRSGCRLFDPAQVRVMREGEDTTGLVVGHFTARTRHLLSAFVERSRRASLTDDPVVLKTVPTGECTAADLAWYEARRICSKLTRPFHRQS